MANFLKKDIADIVQWFYFEKKHFAVGEAMEWLVVDSVSCPFTGTVFISLISSDNRKIILWCTGEYMPYPGDMLFIDLMRGMILINNDVLNSSILKINVFSPSLWSSIQKNARCPGDEKKQPPICMWGRRCVFLRCPYRIYKTPPD